MAHMNGKRSYCWVTLVLAVSLGCTQDPSGSGANTSDPQRRAVFDDAPSANVASVGGHTWDPEAFFYTLANCGMGCVIPPVRVSSVPIFERSVVEGSIVALFDPITSEPKYNIAAPTNAFGSWAIVGVEARTTAPFFAMAFPAAPGSAKLKAFGPPFLVQAPAANYLPTLTLKPIVTRSTLCMSQVAGQISDKGVLEAVAEFRTANGQATSVNDLLLPNVTGGVAVVWLFMPESPQLRVAAGGVNISANRGTVHHINWAPPGALPPNIQSTRGFYVDAAAQTAPLGLSVVVLPPLAGPPAPTQLTFSDPVVDAPTARPWFFPPLPPVTIAPTIISFLELQGVQAGSPPPPYWMCLE